MLKSLFWVLHFLVLKNWTYTHNFNKNLVELISQCGGGELCNHLLSGPKNAQYMSPKHNSKFIEIMIDHIENLFRLTLLRSSYLTSFNDKTQDMTSVEQMTVYRSFEDSSGVADHFLGIYSIKKVAGSSFVSFNLIELVLLMWKWIGLFLKKNHSLRCWVWLFPNWIGALYIVKTTSKKIYALICSMKFLFPEVALYLYKYTRQSSMKHCCHV